jgi:hypothetical protein
LSPVQVAAAALAIIAAGVLIAVGLRFDSWVRRWGSDAIVLRTPWSSSAAAFCLAVIYAGIAAAKATDLDGFSNWFTYVVAVCAALFAFRALRERRTITFDLASGTYTSRQDWLGKSSSGPLSDVVKIGLNNGGNRYSTVTWCYACLNSGKNVLIGKFRTGEEAAKFAGSVAASLNIPTEAGWIRLPGRWI